jgi:hypothetical protein
MRMMGFRVHDNFHVPLASQARARMQARGTTKRKPTMGLAVCDFKGPFACARDGAETSVLGFKHPYSGYVHEFYLTSQNVASAVASFDEFFSRAGQAKYAPYPASHRCAGDECLLRR